MGSKKSIIFPKSISDETKANPECINLNPIISILVLFWNSSCMLVLRIKISDDCSVLWNQLNSNSTLQNKWGNKNKILSIILRKYIKMNYRLYSHLYLHLKDIFALKNSFTFSFKNSFTCVNWFLRKRNLDYKWLKKII